MFISNSEIGKVLTLARDVSVIKGIFKAGSKVKIIDVTNRGYDFIDIESGETCLEVSNIWDDRPIFEEHSK